MIACTLKFCVRASGTQVTALPRSSHLVHKIAADRARSLTTKSKKSAEGFQVARNGHAMARFGTNPALLKHLDGGRNHLQRVTH
jgi:hypothetical protein